MLTVKKEPLGSEGLRVRLVGVLDGGVDFNASIGPPPARLTIHCGQIRHVNSSAVRPWMTYFKKATDRGTELRFEECSPALMDYLNEVPGFTCGGRVESVLANFFCKNCMKEASVKLDTREPSRLQPAIESQRCPSCAGRMDFDEVPEAFFKFLGT